MENNKHVNNHYSFLFYKLLLNRYPECEINKTIENLLDDILNSDEYKNNNYKNNYKYNIYSNKLIIKTDKNNNILSNYNDSIFTYLNDTIIIKLEYNLSKQDIFDTISLIDNYTMFCLNNKLIPTKILYINNKFYIIDYDNSSISLNYMSIYLMFKKIYMEYIFNVNLEKLLFDNIEQNDKNELLNDTVIKYYKFLLNRIPSNEEIYLYKTNILLLFDIYISEEFINLKNKIYCDIDIFSNKLIIFNESINLINPCKLFEILKKTDNYIIINFKLTLDNLNVLKLIKNEDIFHLNSKSNNILNIKNNYNEKEKKILLSILYECILNRKPDVKGLNDKLIELNKNKDYDFFNIIIELFNSDEYIKKKRENKIIKKLLNINKNKNKIKKNIDNNTINIKYYGSLGTSGYSICCKLIIYALNIYNVNIQFVPIDVYNLNDNLNKYDELEIELMNNIIDNPDIIIIHSVADTIPGIIIKEPSNIPKYLITVWETDKIPNEWLNHLKLVDAICVPCEWNKEVFKKDVDVPVECIYHPIILLDKEIDNNYINNIFIENNVNDNTYIFYTINEYNGRKGITELINLYMNNFTKDDNVFLYIKTHGNIQKNECYEYLNKIKNKNTPQIYVDYNILSEKEINGIHSSCHCYISYSKAEGTGYSSCQAVLFNKPIILGNYGASKEYIKQCDFVHVKIQKSIYCDKTYLSHKLCSDYICSYNTLYNLDQSWGVPNSEMFVNKMKNNYYNKTKVGYEISKQYIEENFTIEKVGENFYNSIKNFLKNRQINLSCHFKEFIPEKIKQKYNVKYY
jgi:hypothetical protein